MRPNCMNPHRSLSRSPFLSGSAPHIAVALGLYLAATAPAQQSAQQSARLEGVYTVNPDGQGDRNFESITAAVRALSKRGVKGPVKLVVAAGTYEEAVTLEPIRGVDEDSPVTFQATKEGKVFWNGKKVPREPEKEKEKEQEKKGKKSLFWAAMEAAGLKKKKKKPVAVRRNLPDEHTTVVLSEGTEHLVFDGMVFDETESGAAIFGSPGSSHIELKNRRFGKGIKGQQGSEGVIYVDGHSRCEGWKIHHCVFDLPKLRTGLYFSMVKKFHIQDNRIKLNGVSEGMYFINENRAKNRIERNLITGETAGGSGCAINIALSNLNNDVVDNTILIETNGHAIRTFGTQTNFNRIYGNLIVVTGGGAGIYVNNGTLNHFESDGNLFFVESGNVGTWNEGLQSGLTEWQEATGTGPRGAADKSSTLGKPEMIGTVTQLMCMKPELKQVLLLLGTGDEAGKRLAARACVRMGTDAQAAVPHLALLCHHKSPGVRADAARALGAMGKSGSIAIPELLKLLGDDNHLVAMNAARTLGHFGPLAQKAAPKLVELAEKDTEDGSDELQQVSLDALKKIAPKKGQ